MSPTSLIRREQLALSHRFIAPRTPTEARLATIWASALGMDVVGVEDRYSDLGGDSFLATVIIDEIERTFAIKIQMAVLVEADTAASLAAEVDALVERKRARDA
jgi:acyl carrier protein